MHERSARVRRHQPVPVLVGRVEQGTEDDPPGVVDQHVEAPEPLERERDRRGRGVGEPDVGAQRGDRAVVALELRDLGRDVLGDDPKARPVQLADDLPPEPAGRAGDDRDAALDHSNHDSGSSMITPSVALTWRRIVRAAVAPSASRIARAITMCCSSSRSRPRDWASDRNGPTRVWS